MKSFRVLLFCIAAAYSYEHSFETPYDSINSRIIGGSKAKQLSAPFIVSIQLHGRHNCGGSIISNSWVLTAAHCTTPNPQVYSIIAGTQNNVILRNNFQKRNVDLILIHEKYTIEVGPFDIAMLHVSQPFQFDRFVQPINLPQEGKNHVGEVILFGWGSTSTGIYPSYPDELQIARKIIVSNQKCWLTLGIILHSTNICTGPINGRTSACSGDSGGPLIQVNNAGIIELVGIVSWGKVPCSSPNNPTIYTRVSAYISWINSNIVNF